MMNSCRRSSSDNGVAGDSNTRPTKRVKVESPPSPIPAVPLSYVLPPIIPTPYWVSPPPVAPKRNPIAVGTGSNRNGAQKIPTLGKVAPPPPCNTCRQFWKAGDYEGAPTSGGNWESYAGGSDHIRVHPRFLHSNATSHRWVLGALAELLDNSLDEVRNGATFVNIDMINKKNGDRMLLIEDNGGGMDPIKLRQCMSLGYSAKSKMANTIGQYGNGFKTSSMRLGADAIVFSRFRGEDGSRSTQSIGLLSYTFLRCTRKEDIEVPMLDYERKGEVWERIVRTSDADWNNKVDTIVQWSPFSSEANLLEQFNDIKDHGTRIFIYNLWEDDQGKLELDFDADPYDIQIRGVNRDEKNIQMAQQYPNSRHFLTYRHSLRSYASILYLSIPREFRMILRGKDIEHHNIVTDMMMSQKVTYRPQNSPDGDYRMIADVTVGFVKDAGAHIDVQGFNVYHKNRLIKPFWRVWHPPGSDGRGVIGVLEANFVEPAHDKQGFERTLALSRLEAKLVQMQKNYWSSRCHEIGYAPRRMKKMNNDRDQPSQAPNSEAFTELNVLNPVSGNNISLPSKSLDKSKNGQIGNSNMESNMKKPNNENNGLFNIKKDCGNVHSQTSLLSHQGRSETVRPSPVMLSRSSAAIRRNLNSRSNEIGQRSSPPSEKLTEENRALRESLKMKELELLGDLRRELEEERNKCKFLETELDQEKNRCKSLETQLQEATRQIQELNEEQDSLIDIFSDQRKRYEIDGEKLKNDLKDALSWIKLFRNVDRQEN